MASGLLFLDPMRRFIWLLPTALVAACSFDGPGPGDDQPPGDDTPEPVALYADCQAARADGNDVSGIYAIDPDGSGGFDAYCDMTTDGGGWTLVLKADGHNNTFEYDSPLWTTTTLFNDAAPDHDATEAKLPGFNRVLADEILVETATGKLWIDPGGDPPLIGHMLQGPAVGGLWGKDAWRALVPSSSLPTNCLSLEGVNLGDSEYAARIGILAFGVSWDRDGYTCDAEFGAAIGVGLKSDDSCQGGPDARTSVGNIDDGCYAMPVFAYVYVRTR